MKMVETSSVLLKKCLVLLALCLSFNAVAETPLTTVHPSWTKFNLRPTVFKPLVGGMAFLSDGRLVVGNWGGTRTACCPSGNYGGRQYTGKVYVLSGVTGDNPTVTIDTIATGLEDIMGLTVLRDTIYVSGGNQILRLNRTGNTGPVTRIDTVFILPGTPASGSTDSLHPVKGRSEWLYGMLARNDTFFVNTSSMYNATNTGQVNPYRGLSLAVTLGNGTTNKRGTFKIIANGFRHPTGLSFGPDSTIWTTETQGHWEPTNKLIQIKPGAYYGFRHETGTAPIISVDAGWANLSETPAAVFLPQEINSNKATAIFSGSPGAPFYLSSGPYAGQFVMGDVEWGGIQRYFVEKVNGEYQGAGFVWMGGLESGVYRMATGPDGMLYLGMMGADNDWNWNGQFFGLQKVKYNGSPSFEMLAVRARAQGMEIEFTLPVDSVAAKVPSNYTVQTYYYQPTANYGGTKVGGATTLTPGAIQISSDKKSVYLPLTGLVARVPSQPGQPGTHRVVEITLNSGLKSSTGAASWTAKAYYSLNNISSSTPFNATAIDPGIAKSRLMEGFGYKVQGGNITVQTPFRGPYDLRLRDLRGAILTSVLGVGAESKTLSLQNAHGKFVVVEARGDGVSLKRTVMLP